MIPVTDRIMKSVLVVSLSTWIKAIKYLDACSKIVFATKQVVTLGSVNVSKLQSKLQERIQTIRKLYQNNIIFLYSNNRNNGKH